MTRRPQLIAFASYHKVIDAIINIVIMKHVCNVVTYVAIANKAMQEIVDYKLLRF